MKDRPHGFGPEHSRISDFLVESIHLNDSKTLLTFQRTLAFSVQKRRSHRGLLPVHLSLSVLGGCIAVHTQEVKSKQSCGEMEAEFTAVFCAQNPFI